MTKERAMEIAMDFLKEKNPDSFVLDENWESFDFDDDIWNLPNFDASYYELQLSDQHILYLVFDGNDGGDWITVGSVCPVRTDNIPCWCYPLKKDRVYGVDDPKRIANMIMRICTKCGE